MFVSFEEVTAMTGQDIDIDNIAAAQSLIETYVGRVEADIENPRDLALLAKATAYQAVFMENQSKMVFEQVSMKSITVGGTSYNFPDNATDTLWLAPIAKVACSKLSWLRSRTVKTGKATVPGPRLLDWWTD